jgi:hypothetical protein
MQLVARAVVLGHQRGGEQVDLAHHQPVARVRVEEAAQVAHDGVGLGAVVEGGVRDARQLGRVVGQVGPLAHALHDVDPEAVDPAIEPEPHDAVHGLDHLGVRPVEVGLLGQEAVEVPLAGGVVPGPRGRFDEGGRPVVRRSVRRALAPDVPVALGAVARPAGLDEPRVLVGGVVRHPVDKDPEPAPVGVGQQPVEVVERAEQGVDRAVVGHVVAEVGHR